ncbi:Protein N-terminal and lysine N-methyltransferase efm7 [Dirofilaria immitis]
MSQPELLVNGTIIDEVPGICGNDINELAFSAFILHWLPYAKPILSEFSTGHRTVTVGGRTFRLHQNWQQNGVAGVIWDSGIVLARYISEHPELVANRTVLELGAGLGLPSILSSYQNAKLIHVTDRASTISLLEENIRRNANNDCDIKIFAFDWNVDKLPQEYQEPILFMVALYLNH